MKLINKIINIFSPKNPTYQQIESSIRFPSFESQKLFTLLDCKKINGVNFVVSTKHNTVLTMYNGQKNEYPVEQIDMISRNMDFLTDWIKSDTNEKYGNNEKDIISPVYVPTGTSELGR